MMPRARARSVVGMLALLLGGRVATAQSLRISATEAGSGRPLAGAVIDVLDASSAVVAQGMLSARGDRVLSVSAPGTYRVRVRRIGFAPFIAPPVVVREPGITDLAVTAPERRIVLAAIDVRAANDRRCSRDAFADPAFGALWEQIRTALTATVLNRADPPLQLEARAFHRTVDAQGNVTEERVGLPRRTSASRPYVTRTADYLSRNGYAQARPDGAEFFAPDEQVLLSEQFITDHCFAIARGTDATDGLFGVRFSPTERHQSNDIAGTLWVDSASAELRYLDYSYEYAGIPRELAGAGRTGGQVVFERLPTGAWLVSAWRMRLPRTTQQLIDGAVKRVFTGDYDEIGGVVNASIDEAVPPAPTLIAYRDLLAPARIMGTVYDSLAKRPLAGAQVWLIPTEAPDAVAAGLVPRGGTLAVAPVVDTADADGRYEITHVAAGTYRLAFEHPALDTLGVLPTRYDVRLRPGATVVGHLAVPSLETLARGCALPAGRSAAAHDGIVLGVVSSAADGRPLGNALVRLSWNELSRTAIAANMAQSFSVETRTDSTGAYRLCGLPDSTNAVVQAAGPSSATGQIPTRVGALRVVQVNLRLAEVDSGQSAPLPGIVVGTVTDTLGRPQSEAVVTVDGSTAEARTDASGRFRLAAVTAGTQVIEVKRVGLDGARRAVDVVPGETSVVAFTLARAQLLDAMVVLASRNRSSAAVADAIRRHRTGLGRLVLAEQLKGRGTMRAIVEGLPGVRTDVGEAGTPFDNQMMSAPDLPGVSVAVGQSVSSMEWVALMKIDGRECVARLFVDGHEQDYGYIQAMPIDAVAAVEVFTRAGVAPLFTTGHSIFGRMDSCGSIVVWTKS